MALTKNKTYERGPLLLLKAAYLASYIDKHKLGDIVDRRLQAANWQTGNRQPATVNCKRAAVPTPFKKRPVNMQAHIKIHHNDNDNDNDAQQFVVLQENYVLLAQRRTLR